MSETKNTIRNTIIIPTLRMLMMDEGREVFVYTTFGSLPIDKARKSLSGWKRCLEVRDKNNLPLFENDWVFYQGAKFEIIYDNNYCGWVLFGDNKVHCTIGINGAKPEELEVFYK